MPGGFFPLSIWHCSLCGNMALEDLATSTEAISSHPAFRLNQVVWAKREGVWAPGVVVDEDFAADEEVQIDLAQ